MDGSILVGPTRKSCVFLPSRYIEELDGASSPGLVSKKAAFFEEAIRSASGEKCSTSSKPRISSGACFKVGDDDVIDQSDVIVRTLEFSSGCEESKDSSTESSDATVLEEIMLSLADGENINKVVASIVSSDGSTLKENKDPDGGRQDQELHVRQQENNITKASMRKGNKMHKETLPSMRVSGHLTQGPSTSKRRSSIPSGVPQKNPSRSVNTVRRSAGFQPLALPPETKRIIEGADFKPEQKLELQIPTSTKPQVGTTVAKKHAAKGNRMPENKFDQSKRSTSKTISSGRSHEFRLRSGERAEKRKEFYAKLEERMAAKEQELNRLKAKAQEDNKADLHKLRQSLTFKATPMPDFYHEMPLTRTIKKVPTTRAISPRLGRLKSRASDEIHDEHHHVRLCQQQGNHSATSAAIDSKKVSTRAIIRTSRSAAKASSSSSSASQLSTNQASSSGSCSVEMRQSRFKTRRTFLI